MNGSVEVVMGTDWTELGRLDALEQAALLRRGEVTAVELTRAAIERMERRNPALGAIIHPDPEGALKRAAEVDAQPVGAAGGPLRGVPLAMKDIGGAEAGRPNHAGMRALARAGHREQVDSELTRRLKAAGTVSIGRTNTPELALLPTTEPVAYGPTRNPWKPTHSAGGSSGGAAAAVAAGIVPVAHASDGGGSIRGPASMCGLVGLKPSRGRTSFGPGLGERWNGLSCELVVSRSVRDTAAVLDAVAGAAPGDPYTAPPPAKPYLQVMGERPRRLRIGLLAEGTRGVVCDPEATRCAEAAAALLTGLGHRVEAAYPDALDDHDHVRSYVEIVASNTARALDVYGELLGRPLGEGDVEPLTWALSEMGRALSAPGLIATLQSVHAFGRRVAAFFEDYDLLLTPTQAAPPPELGYFKEGADGPFDGFMRAAPFGLYTLPFNLTGQPAISLPLHMTSASLPMGAQLVAASYREDLLLQVAAELEMAAPWAGRYAGIAGGLASG